jgi:hypothetical protein
MRRSHVQEAMVSNLGLALLLVAAASSAFAAAPGVDEAAIKAFVADITAWSGKHISAFDGQGTALPANPLRSAAPDRSTSRSLS